MTITPLQTASNTLKILSKKDFSSAVAKWAVQLSPYSCPDDLPRVIIKADGAWPISFGPLSKHQQYEWSYDDFKEFVHKFVRNTPEIVSWSTVNSGITYANKFVTAFDVVNTPAEDFIDLNTLAQSIISECWNRE